jgi:amidase
MLEKPDVKQLERLARECGFAIEAEERTQFVLISDALIDVLEKLRTQETLARPALVARRDAGRAPEPGEDPCNAIVRWCRVESDAAGLLSGKSVALKDTIAVGGVPLTCGSRVLSGFVPAHDSVVVERILQAGGAIVAMTNMDDLALSAGGESSYYGPTLNPFDGSRTAGGSSGGAAAALHYDGVDVAVGCDQGGSIRVPSSWCGVIGLKPTHGLVPYTGIVGIDPTFDHAGPMARSCIDVAALLQAMAGKDDSDPRQREVPQRDFVEAVVSAPDTLEGVTLGLVEEGFSEAAGVHTGVAEAVEQATSRFAELGATIERISLPEHRQADGASFATAIQGMTDLLESGGNGFGWKGRYWEELPDALGRGLRDHAGDLSAQVKIYLLLGAWLRRHYSGAFYAKAQNLRPLLVNGYDRALARVDALLMPTTPVAAHRLGLDLPLSERVLRGWAVLVNTIPTDMTGHPALTIPAAETEGLPVGVMLVGPHFADDRLLSLVATYERRYGWLPSGHSLLIDGGLVRY